jgi:hypothetical protein
MNAETVARVIAFLDAHHVMSLATSGESGPHAANVLYVRDDFALLWVSDPISRHSREIARARPHASRQPSQPTTRRLLPFAECRFPGGRALSRALLVAAMHADCSKHVIGLCSNYLRAACGRPVKAWRFIDSNRRGSCSSITVGVSPTRIRSTWHPPNKRSN